MFSGFCLITDNQLSRNGIQHDVAAALSAGVRYIQYRRKTGSALELFREALALRDLCSNALFVINDRVDIAHAVEADGVHLGSNDLPYAAARDILGNRIIGMSASTLEEAIRFHELGANYLGIGPVYPTGTKSDAAPVVGVSAFAELVAESRLPVVGIGGIQVGNFLPLVQAGAKGVAVVVEATHTCMTVRGVRKPGSVCVTSAMKGVFRANVSSRAEVMSLIYGSRAAP